MIEKPLCKIGKLDTDNFLYWYNGRIFDWVQEPFKHANYSSRVYHTLYSGGEKIAEVTKYQMIEIEPIPSPDECRKRMKSIIDDIQDEDALAEYQWFVNLMDVADK